MAVIEDFEERRDSSLRYLTGMPQDAILFLFPGPGEGRTVLIPWDEILAEKYAQVDEVIPYGRYERRFPQALKDQFVRAGLKAGSPVELPPGIPIWRMKALREALPEAEFSCRAAGLSDKISRLRMIKDKTELEIIRQGAVFTNRLIIELEMEIRKGNLRTEMDAALFLERRSRTLGCDGLGFPTLAAGPGRSWGIHAFPPYTAGEFGGNGFSLIDFGVSYRGYITDVTVSLVKGRLSKAQEEMLTLVEGAYTQCAEMFKPGGSTQGIALRAAEIFSSRGWTMPHGLGHSFGIDCHEQPFLSVDKERDTELKPGMVMTLEPGLYHQEWGGLRWENDFLITKDGAECLTTSRIIRL
ncbi:MAG: Xaa-Pro peptidase family protein [Spirochaetales bacterium]|nr:Xaa-Pro peptidase family protein [Spirochaetales bacterium]